MGWIVWIIAAILYLVAWGYLGQRVYATQQKACGDRGCMDCGWMCFTHGLVGWTARLFWPALLLAYPLKWAMLLGDKHAESHEVHKTRSETARLEAEADHARAKQAALEAQRALVEEEARVHQAKIDLEAARAKTTALNDGAPWQQPGRHPGK